MSGLVSERSHYYNMLIGQTFDDEVVAAELIRHNAGGNGYHHREAWRCTGEQATYYVKLFEDSDTGWDPEAAFYETYGKSLDFVAPGFAYSGLDTEPFAKAVVTREVDGVTLDRLLETADSPELRQTRSAIGARSMKKLHATEVTGFGLLTQDGFTYSSWRDYIDAVTDKHASQREVLVDGGLTHYEIDKVSDVIQRTKDDTVTPVLCHGDPKPVHVVTDGATGTLIDFGRAQGNIPLRDCLQYGNFDPTYFDAETLVTTIMEGVDAEPAWLQAEALIKLSGILVYSVRRGDLAHGKVISQLVRSVMHDDWLPQPEHTSVATYYDAANGIRLSSQQVLS